MEFCSGEKLGLKCPQLGGRSTGGMQIVRSYNGGGGGGIGGLRAVFSFLRSDCI